MLAAGYSLATGEFNGDHSEDVAVGMPKGLNLTGKVSDAGWMVGRVSGPRSGTCVAIRLSPRAISMNY